MKSYRKKEEKYIKTQIVAANHRCLYYHMLGEPIYVLTVFWKIVFHYIQGPLILTSSHNAAFSGIVLSLELHNAAAAESSARNRLLPIIPVSIVKELKTIILPVHTLHQNQWWVLLFLYLFQFPCVSLVSTITYYFYEVDVGRAPPVRNYGKY